MRLLNQPSGLRRLPRLALCLLSALFTTGILHAEVVTVESRSGGQNFANYSEGTGNWFDSSAKSSASGVTSGLGSRFATEDSSTFTVTPTLDNAGGSYIVEVTHGRSSNIPVDLQVGITVNLGSGLPADTDAFNQLPDNVWRTVGTLVLDAGQTSPTLTFTKLSGASGAGQRFYADAVRFTFAGDPCLSVPELATVNGPLAANQTFVNVPNVMSNATEVVVYADGVEIGRKTNDIAGGVEVVATDPLVKGQVITATQVDTNNIESCRPTTGAFVGGGANPRLRISLSIRQNTELTGPIGADGGTTGSPVFFLGGTGTFGGSYALAPLDGRVLAPEGCWQTVTFQRGNDPANPIDPTYPWTTGGSAPLEGNFGVLDGIALAIDDLTDNGPFRIYIDDLMNGETMVQDFEAATNTQHTVTFTRPSFSGTTNPFLLAQPPGSISPDISQVTTDQAESGKNSLLVSWQFRDYAGGNWVRLTAQGTGVSNPQLDLRLPISFRILLLPAGQTDFPLQFSVQPQNTIALEDQPFTLRSSGCGTAPVTYQWFFNGAPILDATNKNYAVANAVFSDVGDYYVVVSDSSGSLQSSTAKVSVESGGGRDMFVPLWNLAPGDRPYLSLDDQQSDLAFNPSSGNLLMVSRSSGDEIIVLNSANGDEVAKLNLDPSTIKGGLYAVNKVGISADGSVFACNVTTNSAVDSFKIYSWFDDFPGGAPFLSWEGNPGGEFDTNRWGDTFALRDYHYEEFLIPEFLVAARDNSRVARISPGLAEQVFLVTNVPPGAFNHGLTWGEGDTFWGKSYNGDLYHVALDLTNETSTVLAVYSNLLSLGPIGVDISNSFLGGISLVSPTSLRLLDMENSGQGPLLLDNADFPTDNPNPNALGAVTFGNGNVYALNANNGIVAMKIRPWLRMTRQNSLLTLRWSEPYILQAASLITDEFLDVEGAVNPYTIDTTTNQLGFFRLRD